MAIKLNRGRQPKKTFGEAKHTIRFSVNGYKILTELGIKDFEILDDKLQKLNAKQTKKLIAEYSKLRGLNLINKESIS